MATITQQRRVSSLAAPRRRAAGFTLVELVIVLAIAAVLMTLVLPSFRRIIQGGVVSSTVNSFLADMRFARSEAMKRGGSVVLCRSADPEAAEPVCSGAAPAEPGWATGWIIFQDLNGDGARDAADPVLRVRAAASGLDAMDGGTASSYAFTALGRLPGPAVGAMFFGGAGIDPEVRRTVCILATGSARVQASGVTSCA